MTITSPASTLTLEGTAAAFRDGSLSSAALTRSLLDDVAARNDELGAFVTVCEETAMEAAALADAAFGAGIDNGPLQGIPLAIKDIIATEQAPTTANSRVLDPAWGRGADAPVVARLRAAGAFVLGKATTSEFATGVPDPQTGFRTPCNPWNLEHTAAGSSSGTGVAIAAGLALGGLGTDTGGSVRSPAAMNGITGLKVTFGRVPKNGVVTLAHTLDSVGPMSRTAMGCALLLEAMAGHDPGDPYASDAAVGPYAALASAPVDGRRVGIPTSYFFDHPGLDAEVRAGVLAAVDVLAAAGAEVVEVDLPWSEEAKAANTIIGGGEALAYHRLDLRGRWDDYGRNTRTNLSRGAMFSAGDYVQAQRFRTFYRRELQRVFADVDVLVTPTAAKPAARRADIGMFRDYEAPSFTAQWNLAGSPALAVPCGFSSSGLPLSMQVVGRPFDEGTVLGVGHAYQQRTDWHLRPCPAPVVAP